MSQFDAARMAAVMHDLLALVRGTLQERHPLEVVGERHDRCVGAGIPHEPCQPVVEPEAVADDQVGVGDSADVAGRRVEGVDLAALRNEAVDADAVTADLADHVREDRRGRDHVHRAVLGGGGGRGISALAACGDEDGET